MSNILNKKRLTLFVRSVKLTLFNKVNAKERRKEDIDLKFDIKAKREAKKMSQEELARAAGISRTTLSRMETNEDTVVNSTTLSKIAEALDCPVASLLVE